MSLRSRLLLATVTFALPLSVFAAAPDNVTGIKAWMDNGQVKVSWNQVSGSIASYRIFYSHESILQNKGLYDDFDFADGSTNLYVFPSVPPYDTLYVSVLAVDQAGEESAYFVQEASVQLKGGSSMATMSSAATSTPTQVSSATPSSASMLQASSVMQTTSTNTTSSSLRLLTVQSVSSTGVLLTFSDKVVIPQEDGMQAFLINYGSGLTLPLRRITMSGSQVLLDTFPQVLHSVYLLHAGAVISGINAQGESIPLDSDQVPLFFMMQEQGASSSYAFSTGQSSAAASSMPTGSTQDPEDLQLRAKDEGGGKFTIAVTWSAPSAPGVAGYVITESTDNGATFGPAFRVSAATLSATIPHVSSALIGVNIRALYANGQLSPGVFQSITLKNVPAGQSSSVTVTPPIGSVTEVPSGHGTLPSSGPDVWMVALIAGVIVTWRKMRHSMRQTA